VNVRHALVLMVALSAVGCAADDSGTQLPVAPASAITVAAPTGTISGTTLAEMVRDTSDCPPASGIGLRASTGGAAVTVVFPRWPDEGAVYDLSVPGTSDFVTVSALADNHVYCAADQGAAGSIVVSRFGAVGTRMLADVQLVGVISGATSIDAHLYH
jgi:hypothetical protein